MSEKDGGSAFPSTETNREWSENAADYLPVTRPTGGMSMRDWFAGQALAGWLASYTGDLAHPATREGGAAAVATHAYFMADAMLKERAK
jgi:hypothetical protein